MAPRQEIEASHYTISRDHTGTVGDHEDLTVLLKPQDDNIDISPDQNRGRKSPLPERNRLAGVQPRSRNASHLSGSISPSNNSSGEAVDNMEIEVSDDNRPTPLAAQLAFPRDSWSARDDTHGSRYREEVEWSRTSRRRYSSSSASSVPRKTKTKGPSKSDIIDIDALLAGTGPQKKKKKLQVFVPERHRETKRNKNATTLSSMNHNMTYDEEGDSSLQNHNDIDARISKLQREIKDLERKKRPVLTQQWKIIHRVTEKAEYDPEDPESHIKLYVDHPRFYGEASGKGSLAGTEPILNLESYLDRHPEFAFIVFRDYETVKDNRRQTRSLGRQASYHDPHASEAIPISESIRLTSKDLLSAWNNFITSIPDYNGIAYPHSEFEEEIPAPYLVIYFQREIFQSMSTLLPDKIQPVWQLFQEYIQRAFWAEYDEADRLFSQGLVNSTYLKYLYRPGEVLLFPKHIQASAVQLKSLCSLLEDDEEVDASRIRRYSEVPVKIAIGDSTKDLCWSLDISWWLLDTNFKRISDYACVYLPPDDNLKQITSLEVYPIQYASREEQHRIELQGRSLWKSRRRRFVEYSKDDGVHAWDNTKARYMIDPQTFSKMHAFRERRSAKISTKYMPQTTFDQEECPEYPFYMLTQRTIEGFNFTEKAWVDLQLDYVTDINWNTKAFENLVTDEETKDLLEALVTKQLNAEASTDLIAGKGNGLIILLHGGPGTGKTYTAESVADYARKPLYRVTCGDIGTEPGRVEKYLENVLRLGRIWSCVVLLDEADVFLEERSLADLERNALVSVFLRMLEYYNGILVLTSNRVGHFDEAFRSRIQLALHYKSLDRNQRTQIWTNFIKNLRASGLCEMDFDDLVLHIHDLSSHEMNGRQIRNIITTARQLAEFRGKSLNFEILQKVIKVAGKFDTYLHNVKKMKTVKDGTVDDEIARDAGAR